MLTPLLRPFESRKKLRRLQKDISGNIIFQKREGKASAGVELELVGVLGVVNGMMGVRREGARALKL